MTWIIIAILALIGAAALGLLWLLGHPSAKTARKWGD